MRLYEIRTSNLNKIKGITYSKAARRYPVELLRLLYKMLEEKGVTIDDNIRKEEIKKLKRNMDDSLGIGNLWVDHNNDSEIDIGNKIYIRWSTKGGHITVIPHFTMFPNIELTFDFDDTIHTIFSRVVDFMSETISKYKKLMKQHDYDGIVELGKKLKDEYTNNKEPKFVKYIRKLCNKYGFTFYDKGELRYDIQFDVDKLYPGISDYINTTVTGDLKSTDNAFQLEILQKHVFPILIKKIENSNYLIKDFRKLSDFFHLILTQENENKAIPNAPNITYGQRHERKKEIMMQTNNDAEPIHFNDVTHLIIKNVLK